MHVWADMSERARHTRAIHLRKMNISPRHGRVTHLRAITVLVRHFILMHAIVRYERNGV
jgi:hypothetical protein